MTNNTIVSLIIISKNEGHNLKQTVDFIFNYKTNIPTEVIVIDDGSTDKSTTFLSKSPYNNIKYYRIDNEGPAKARALGVRNANGEIFIFLDAHVIPQGNWLDSMIDRFSDPNVFSIAPVLGGFNPSHPDIYGVNLDANLQPYWVTQKVNNFSPIPFAGAGCLSIRKEAYEGIEGFDTGFIGIGFGDIDFCLRLWLMGYNIYLDPSIKILHNFRKTKPYKIFPENITYNFLRLAFKHFSEEKIAKAINYVKKADNFGEILVKVLGSDVWEKRLQMQAKQKHDKNWFFSKFTIK